MRGAIWREDFPFFSEQNDEACFDLEQGWAGDIETICEAGIGKRSRLHFDGAAVCDGGDRFIEAIFGPRESG